MKRNILYILGALLLTAGGVSCSNFLNEYSQNATYIESVDDLDELLLGGAYLDKTPPLASLIIGTLNYTTTGANQFVYLHLLADESREAIVPFTGYNASAPTWYQLRGIWSWNEYPFTDAIDTPYIDKDWANFYTRISVINNVIGASISYDFTEKEQTALARVRGEAYFLRAWNYFMLANIYGTPYDKDNLNDGASVTLKISEKIVEDKFFRSNTGDVYRQIVSDLKDAIAWFGQGDSAKSKYYGSADAAYALLSRVYLYMEEYQLAIDAANKVSGYMLFNLAGNYTAGSGNSFLTVDSPEVIFGQGFYSTPIVHKGTHEYDSNNLPIMYGASYSVSSELEQMFDDNDMRYSAFFTRSYGEGLLVSRKNRQVLYNVSETDPVTGAPVPVAAGGASFNESSSLRYAEVLLNKAEAQACLGDAAAATTIAPLLDARYLVPPTVPSGGEQLITFIRNERRKELCFEGHRWFDLRRYAVNKVAPYTTQIRHDYTVIENDVATTPGYYTLASYSEATRGSWMLPVPDEVLDFNFPNITNPDRKAGVSLTNY